MNCRCQSPPWKQLPGVETKEDPNRTEYRGSAQGQETGHSCSSLVRVKSCRHEIYLKGKLACEGALQCCSIKERDPSVFHLPGLLLMHKKRGLYQKQAKSYQEFLWFLVFLHRKVIDRLDPEICTYILSQSLYLVPSLFTSAVPRISHILHIAAPDT